MRYPTLPRDGCPICFHVLDAATAIDDETSKPMPGDLTVCLYCGGLLKFDAARRHARLPDDEFRALPAALQLQLLRVQAAVTLRLAKPITHHPSPITMPEAQQ